MGDYFELLEDIIETKDIKHIKKTISQYDKSLKKEETEHNNFFGQLISVLAKKEADCNIILSAIKGWDGLKEIEKLLVKISTDFTSNRDENKDIVK